LQKNTLHALGHQVCLYVIDKDGERFDYPQSCGYKPIAAHAATTKIDALVEQYIQGFVEYVTLSMLSAMSNRSFYPYFPI